MSCPRCSQAGTCGLTASTGAYPSWVCDKCGAGPFSDGSMRVHCSNCSLDLCSSCQHTTRTMPCWVPHPVAPAMPGWGPPPVAPAMPTSFQCPGGHVAALTPGATIWFCDVCTQQHPAGAPSMHCATCNYDCCVACKDLLALLVCPAKNHPLSFTNTAAAVGAPAVGWSCDVCKRPGGQHSYRCDTCDYDLCTACLPQALQRQAAFYNAHNQTAATAIANIASTSASLSHSTTAATSATDPDLPPWGDGVKRLVRILPSDPQYAECLSVVTPTMPPGLRVLSVDCVQNSALYRWFSATRRQIAQENNGDPNSALAMHGTRGKRACEVAFDDQGIDLRFSSNGMFGRAAYFSYNTKYVTDSYAYSSSRAMQQTTFHQGAPPPAGGSNAPDFIEFLVCDVTRGKVEQKGAASSIVRPSPGFRSIEGCVTAGVTAVMCYQLYQAYPKYVVTCVALTAS